MNNSPPSSSPNQDNRKRNALVISLSTGLLFAVLSAILGPIAYAQNGMDGLWGVGLTVLVSISGLVASYLVFRNRVSLGSGILVSTILLLALSLPVVAHGQGLALGVMIIVVVAAISSATLSPPWATRANISAFIIASMITLTDLYFPDFGLPTNPQYANLMAIVITSVYTFFLFRNFNTFALRTKIIIAFVVVTIIPLVALGYFNSQASAKALETQNRKQLSTLANQVSNDIDGFMTNQLNETFTEAKQSSLAQFINLPDTARAGSGAEAAARLTLSALTRKDPVFIRSIGVLDITGANILDSLPAHEGQNEAGFTYFIRPTQTHAGFVSNVVFYSGRASLYFSAPIFDSESRAAIGVLRTEYDATVLQAILLDADPEDPETTISLIDPSTYLQIAASGGHNQLFTSVHNFSDLLLAALQAENRLPFDTKEHLLAEADESLVAGLDSLQQQPFFNGYSQSLASDTINTGKFLETQPWIALVRQSTKVYLAPIKEQNRTTILISLALVILSVAAGYYASQILTAPLITLSQVAEKITAGDRSARANATTEDEIGRLSRSFNRMTDELNQAFNSLEVRVAERTTDLEIARQQSEKRAGDLQSISEISKVITGEQKLEDLLPLISRLVSESFGFYHTGIFLLDETKQFAVLQAANSAGGKKMLAREHRLEVGGSGIVGFVAQSGLPRIALDVGLDAVFFNNPDLPNTRSEMALPLKGRDQIVGVLDVQSEKPGAFTEIDANTLSILADQIAIALENARLFSQTQQALDEAQALYRQNSQESWLTFSREESSVGYQHNIKGGSKLTAPVDSEEIRQSMNRGNVMVFNANGQTQEPSIVVPIKLRGQIIGAMNIKAPSQDRHWSTDEINLAEAISERLSLALENARLIQESQRQVIKEQTISDITGKIGASINLKNVLQTAVEELGRAMPGSEVKIQFKSNDK
jgi:GAF domain-containing protein/HAMP domain-containing protein